MGIELVRYSGINYLPRLLFAAARGNWTRGTLKYQLNAQVNLVSRGSPSRLWLYHFSRGKSTAKIIGCDMGEGGRGVGEGWPNLGSWVPGEHMTDSTYQLDVLHLWALLLVATCPPTKRKSEHRFPPLEWSTRNIRFINLCICISSVTNCLHFTIAIKLESNRITTFPNRYSKYYSAYTTPFGTTTASSALFVTLGSFDCSFRSVHFLRWRDVAYTGTSDFWPEHRLLDNSLLNIVLIYLYMYF